MLYFFVLFYIGIVILSFLTISLTQVSELDDVQKCLILLLILFWPITLLSFVIFGFLFSMLWLISSALAQKDS